MIISQRPETPVADSRNIFGKASAYEKENFIDDVFEASEEGPSGWVLPPSLMAVAAVPGAPVINPRVPKDVGEDEEDAYLRFMPVPAVPGPDTQAARRPKESLDSFDLNLNLANTVDLKSESSGTSNRPKFKQCQARCLKEFCVPVEGKPVYEECLTKCKTFCS